MAELRWTLEALDWLEDIHRYVAQDNPTAANNVIDGILHKTDVLTVSPMWVRACARCRRARFE